MFAATKQLLTPAVAGISSVSESFLLWLDAADFNGTTWTAKKGTSPTKNGTVSSSTYNGFPSALFGSGGYFTVPSFVAPSHLAAFAVMFQPSGVPLIVEQSIQVTNTRDGFYFYSDSYFPYGLRRAPHNVVAFNKPDNSDWFAEASFGLGSINFNGTNLNLQYNGTAVSTSVSSGSVSNYASSTNVTDTLYIGSRGGTGISFATGHLCELIISPSLSTESYSLVTSHLKTKYSL